MVWMMVNMTLGIYYGLLFAENGLGIWNILYYIFFLGSLFVLIRYYLRTWKQKFSAWLASLFYWPLPSRMIGAPPFPMIIIFAFCEAAPVPSWP